MPLIVLDTNVVVAALNQVGRVVERLAGFDLAIASVALVHGATLVTHDGGLLDGAISELKVEDWLAE